MDQLTFTVIVTGAMMIAYYGGRWMLMRDLKQQQEQAHHMAENLVKAIVLAQQKREQDDQEWNEAFEMHGDGNEYLDPQLELWAEEDLDELQNNKDL